MKLYNKIKFSLKMWLFKPKSNKEKTFKEIQKIIAETNKGYHPDWGNNGVVCFTCKEMAEYACKNDKFINIYKDLLS